MTPSRRLFLGAAVLAAGLAARTGAARAADAPAGDPYDTLRHRWLDLALGTGYDPAAEPYASRLAETGALARDFRATMAPAPTSLWPGYPYDPPSGITQSYSRLWTMTQAYVQQGTGSTGDPALLADVLRGLDHLAATVYNPATTRYGNWWEWQIGSPRLLMDITAALHDHLTDAQLTAACAAVDHFVPDSALGEQVLLDGLGRLFALLAGSEWEVTDPNRQIVLDSVEHAYAPLIHDGLMMDSVNGRAISRGYLKNDDRHVLRSDHFHGQGIIAAMALLAGGASPAERERWYGRIKGWIERDTVTPILTARQFDVADLARLHAVADSAVPAAPEPTGHRVFPAMDRAVHRRPTFTANISMASDRIAHYECGNGENPRGWHTGAGMVLWWAAGAPSDQYTDWFWPTVDWYRLPGTTVSTRRLADRAGGEWGEPKPDVRWVGGTTDGEYAAVGQHLKGLGSTLEARKSWFCAADAVICLGAGITCADGVPVETVVDNRNLGERGTQAFVRGRRWAHLEGQGGWVVPDGELRTLREDRTGAWADINATSTAQSHTRGWQTLWLDHGTDPTDAAYVYLLMPGASRRAVAARAADRNWLTVLANDVRRQAVHVPSLGLTAANFWQGAEAGQLAASAGASVLLRRTGRTVTLCVSEPPRTGEPLEIVWDRPVHRVVRADDSVEVLSAGRRLRLRVTPGMACATHECELALSP